MGKKKKDKFLNADMYSTNDAVYEILKDCPKLYEAVVHDATLNCPVPFFDSYEDAQKYFTEHFEELRSKIEGIRYKKLFTRVTTIEKLENFRKIARNGKPYSFFKNNQEDNKYLDEVLGPRLI